MAMLNYQRVNVLAITYWGNQSALWTWVQQIKEVHFVIFVIQRYSRKINLSMEAYTASYPQVIIVIRWSYVRKQPRLVMSIVMNQQYMIKNYQHLKSDQNWRSESDHSHH